MPTAEQRAAAKIASKPAISYGDALRMKKGQPPKGGGKASYIDVLRTTPPGQNKGGGKGWGGDGKGKGGKGG